MAEETENIEPQEAPPPGKRKKIVLIGAVVASILAGGAVGVLVAGPVVAKRAGFVASTATDSSATHADSASGEHGEGGEGSGTPASVHLIDNLVLNPAGSGGTRFLMLAAAIEARDNAVIESLKARDAEVRDAVLRVMGSKTVEQLSDMTSRDSLKVELAAALGAMLPKDAIKRIYFPQFVIQ